jgi:spermidine/putrescine ABC transporter ATP-binding subunit
MDAPVPPDPAQVGRPGGSGVGDDLAIAAEGIEKSFGGVAVLRSVDLHVRRGEFVSLLGPSGCGKTTLLRIIGGFETQTAGTVRIHGELVDGRPPNKRPVNMVFQRYALFPNRTVGENIAFPMELKGVPKQTRAQRIREMLELVRLPHIEDRYATQISGGQAQRVAVARALVAEPEVLLLDEPLGALDLKLRKHMQLELRRIHEELGTTFVYVTHDQEEALTMSDRIVLMNEGEIVQEGTPLEIYDQPNSLFSSSFVGEVNLLSGTIAAIDANATVVHLAVGGRAVGAPVDAVVGDAVSVAVRPEVLEIDQRGAADESENAVEGEVARVVFLGNSIHVHVDLGEGIALMVESDRGREPPTAGQAVTVRWAGARSVILAESATDDTIKALTEGTG